MLAEGPVDLRRDDCGTGLVHGGLARFTGFHIPTGEKYDHPEDRANRDNLQMDASVRPDQRV